MGQIKNSQTDVTTHVLEDVVLSLGSGNLRLPTTITFKSSNVGKALEISTDGGVEFFVPEIDTTTATMIVLVLNAPVTNIRATGDVGDTLVIGQ